MQCKSTSNSTFKIYLWKCYKYYCDVWNDFLPEHKGECQGSSNRKQERSNNTQLATALTCTQQCTYLLEERSHTSFANCTFPDFSRAFSSFPLTHLMQEHPQLWSLIRYIRLFSPLHWQKLGAHPPSCSPHADKNTLVFSVQPWPHKHQNLPLPSLWPLRESFSVPSCDYPPLSYLLFSKKNNFLCCLWRNLKSYTFSVVVIFLLFCLLRAKSAVQAASSFTAKNLTWRAWRGKLQNLSPIFFCPQFTSLFLLAKKHEREHLCSPLH